jgi:AraC-like DNA-binding protein
MFYRQFFFTIFLILSVTFSLAQNQKDLKKMSYNQLKDSVKGNFNFKKKQETFAKEYLSKAKKENDIEEIATGYYLHTFFANNHLYYKYCDSIIFLTKNSKSIKFPMLAFTRKSIKDIENNKYINAVENLLLSEKYALLRNNLDFYFDAKNNIGIIKSVYLAEYKEALSLYKESYDYFYKKENDGDNYRDYLITIIFGMADAFKSLNDSESTTYYNKLGYLKSLKYKNDEMKYLFVLNEGANHTLKKNYIAAIDSINIALPKLKKMSNIGNNILAAYYYYGKAYEGLKNYKKAAENFIKVDSIYNKNKKITPKFTDGYRFLIEYYKKTNNKDKQLYYINALMSIDSSFQINYKQLSQKLHKNYDIPTIIRQKEFVINGLNNDKLLNYSVIIVLVILVFLSFFFMVNQKKVYKKRFDKLIRQNQQIEEIIKKDKIIPKVTSSNTEISPEIVSDILQKLINFERQKLYLNPLITLQSLAQNFNSNSKYLSSIINNNINKSFTHYINDLRIDNIVNELKNNKKLRKYTVNSIAEEAGFNTGESFSKAFSKRTGIKPAYFIKKLNES